MLVQVLVKMKRKVVIPANAEEIVFIRNYPQKHVDFPTYSRQKFDLCFDGSICVHDVLNWIRNL